MTSMTFVQSTFKLNLAEYPPTNQEQIEKNCEKDSGRGWRKSFNRGSENHSTLMFRVNSSDLNNNRMFLHRIIMSH